jgi:hypothetical protein
MIPISQPRICQLSQKCAQPLLEPRFPAIRGPISGRIRSHSAMVQTTRPASDRNRRPALRGRAAWLCLLALLGWADAAAAHGRSHSYSTWEIQGSEVQVRARLPRIEVTRLAPLGLRTTTGPAVSRYLADALRLSAAGEPCEIVSAPTPLPGPEAWSIHGWRLRCPGPDDWAIESRVLIEAAPSHLHFARIVSPDGSVSERVLHEAGPVWQLSSADADAGEPTATPAPSAFSSYVGLGIEHILSGWDHLAFVFALLLLASRLSEVAGLVTGFTVGHSVTLALAVLGFVQTEATAVEAAIAFSVALVAVENSWTLADRQRVVAVAVVTALVAASAASALGVGGVGALTWLGLAIFAGCHFALLDRSDRPARLRSALALAFGLIHGFGFAGVLAELHLPPDRLAQALFGFNLGVEIGQLAVVVLAWPVLAGLAALGKGRARRAVAEIGSAAIAGLGLYWLVLRAAG